MGRRLWIICYLISTNTSVVLGTGFADPTIRCGISSCWINDATDDNLNVNSIRICCVSARKHLCACKFLLLVSSPNSPLKYDKDLMAGNNQQGYRYRAQFLHSQPPPDSLQTNTQSRAFYWKRCHRERNLTFEK